MQLVNNSNLIRYLVSVFLAILIASIVEYFFSMTHGLLIPITALFVMLTSVGNMIYQSAQRYIVMLFIVTVFSIIFPPFHLLYWRVIDVSLGAMIGIGMNLLVLPRHADVEFRQRIFPVLLASENFFVDTIAVLIKDKPEFDEMLQKELEQSVQGLPVWVLNRGFDLGLQKGQSYFLIKTYHVVEALLALRSMARFQFEADLIQLMKSDIQNCATKTIAFFNALTHVLQLKKLSEGVEEFHNDIVMLDKKFQDLLPLSPDLLSLADEDSRFYAIIYCLNDLHKALVKLGQALR